MRHVAPRAPLAISPHAMPQRVARASRSGLPAPDNAARTVAPRRHVRSCSRCVPKSQTVCAILRRQRLAARPSAVAQHLSRPSPLASWGVVARHVAPHAPLAISPRAMPQRVARAPRSGLPAPDNAARTVAPRRHVRSCSRCVPKSQTVCTILRRQRLAAQPSAVA